MKGIDLISGIGWQYRAGTLVLFLLLLFPLPALAQTTVSTIEGTIKDAQGSVVSGANVKVKSTALGIERDATSDANGFYRVTALPAGNYSLTITHAGFTTRTFDDIELTVNRTLTLDIPLEVGAVSEQVDVVEFAQLLNPTSSSTGRPTPAAIMRPRCWASVPEITTSLSMVSRIKTRSTAALRRSSTRRQSRSFRCSPPVSAPSLDKHRAQS